MGLYVEGPSTPSQKVAGGGANQSISGTFDAGSAPNGTFTVTLKGEITQTKYASSTFKLRRPAESPGNVNASLQGTTKVLVTWSKGSEPDLQSYEVSNSQTGTVGRLSADSACAGSSCKAALAVPTKAAGQKVGFTVQAFRSDGDGGSIGSGNSAAAYITFPAPPAAQPKKTTSAQQTPKNDAKSVDSLPTLPAKKQTLPTSKPTTHKPKTSKLPQIPDTDAKGNLPIPTADTSTGDQGETDGLTPAGTKDETGSTPVQTSGVKAQSNESPIGNIGQYGLYVAGGLLLLLLGAHAGAWARRRTLASGSAGPTPTPVATASPVPAPPGGTAPATTPANESSPQGAPAPRRPAVILAVAKTRVPNQTRTQEPSSARQQPTPGHPPSLQQPGSLNQPSSAHQPPPATQSSAHQPPPATQSAAHQLASAQQPVSAPQAAAQRLAAQQASAQRWSSGPQQPADDLRPPSAQPSDGVALGGQPSVHDKGRTEVPSARPLYLDAEGEARGPVHISLPSSAVTDVPPSAATPVIPPAVRIEDRWDDYLPPSPRSMEDSGFWERPQPGSADFWAADNNEDGGEQAYAGHRRGDGDS
ncbi:hypothetical protein GCM10022419_067280 [Nonomuraea rosea]|uniref:Fibronectin type-III domain-containing protein n=2 Tax=Nonomuraea rosea TaxID=638574 RepID=A0ABP6Y3A6_9ACTN